MGRSFEERMEIIQEKVREERIYLDSLSVDPTPIIEVVKKCIDGWDSVQLSP